MSHYSEIDEKFDEFIIDDAEVASFLTSPDVVLLMQKYFAQCSLNSDIPIRIPDTKIQVTYQSEIDAFKIIFWGEEPDIRGASKYIKPNNYVILVKNIPLWNWFLGCVGQRILVKAWETVRVSKSSPGFKSKSFGETLRAEGFFPEEKAGASGTSSSIMYMDIDRGKNLWIYKLLGKPIDDAFLIALLHYLLGFLEEKKFHDIHDVKPQNILYHEKLRRFELRDYQAAEITFSFCCPQAHPTELERKWLSTQFLADNVAMTIFILLDRNKEKTKIIFESFFATYTSKFPTHPFYQFLNDTIQYIIRP